jgi:hypothetical protein
MQASQVEMLNKAQACDYLGISLATLNRNMRLRKIPYYKYGPPTRRGGGRVTLSRKDLDKFRERCRIDVIA